MAEPKEIYQVYPPGGKNLDEIVDDLVVQINEQLQSIAEEIAGKYLEWRTLADDPTPSVKDHRHFLTGGTTTITDFDDGTNLQEIIIVAEHSITITDGTNIYLSGSSNWAMTATDTLTLICKADNKWYEIARSDSGA